mgnify:CR=1 FL=1
MFGELIRLQGNSVIVKNLTGKVDLQCLNYHVIIPEKDRNVVGEILHITDDEIEISLVGEIINNRFTLGMTKKPNTINNLRFLYKSELELLIGHQNDIDGEFEVGDSCIYNGYKVCARTNTFFANHFAILGNSGFGKSCGVARLLQNILKEKNNRIPDNAHIVLFDAYGEYNQAFNNLNNINGLNFKKFTTEFNDSEDSQILQIPTFLLDEDDYTLLLNADSTSQMHVIKKALKLVYIFNSGRSDMLQYQNEIIAKCIMDILSTGKTASQLRDQIVAVLTSYNTPDINLDTIISQPGYNRTLRQCLNIDDQGKMSALNLVIEELQKYTKVNSEDVILQSKETITTEVPFTKDSGVCKVKCSVNGLPLHFIFDTGASDVTISMVEATFMLKNGYLDDNDVVGSQRYMDANGNVSVGTTINLKEVNFGGLNLTNVRASVVRNQKAPLLLGQTVLGRLGKIEIDNSANVLKITHNK